LTILFVKEVGSVESLLEIKFSLVKPIFCIVLSCDGIPLPSPENLVCDFVPGLADESDCEEIDRWKVFEAGSEKLTGHTGDWKCHGDRVIGANLG